MRERLAVDTNAVIASLRSHPDDRVPLDTEAEIIVPLPVLGELYFGAFISSMREANLRLIAGILERSSLLRADEDTARLYGQLRARYRLDNIAASKMNDVWIAALCIQHGLPLLTNDRGFDSLPELRVIHW
jgi:tRNA(fMet)-specific endonuclease VapC